MTNTITDFTIWDNDKPTAYVERSELKEMLSWNEYNELLRFMITKGLQCYKKGVPVKALNLFLAEQRCKEC